MLKNPAQFFLEPTCFRRCFFICFFGCFFSCAFTSGTANAYPGATAREMKTYANRRCISTLIAAGSYNRFAAMRSDAIVVESSAVRKPGFYILFKDQTFFAPLKETANGTDSKASPTATTLSLEIRFPGSPDRVLKVWYRKNDVWGRVVRMHTGGENLAYDNFMMEDEESRIQQAIVARPTDEVEFESNLARRIEAIRSDMGLLLADEVSDVEETSVPRATAATSDERKKITDAVPRLTERRRLALVAKFKETLRNDYGSFVKTLELCAQALGGESKLASQKSLESLKQEFEPKIMATDRQQDFQKFAKRNW